MISLLALCVCTFIFPCIELSILHDIEQFSTIVVAFCDSVNIVASYEFALYFQ
jgi:hypothetical protein